MGSTRSSDFFAIPGTWQGADCPFLIRACRRGGIVFGVLGALETALRVPEDRWASLEAGCQSEFERQVLHAIRARGLPLPDAAQQTLYDGDEPVAIADFYYDPKIVIFVDGSPHYRDYVAAADATKRKRLKARGYRILAITGDQLDERLDTLAQWLGG